MSGDYETHNNQQPHINYAGNKVDLDKYALFVDGVTSDPSKDYQSFIESVSSLDGKGANIHRLLTAAVGISAEGVNLWRSLRRWFSKVSLGIMIIGSISLLSWEMLCGT